MLATAPPYATMSSTLGRSNCGRIVGNVARATRLSDDNDTSHRIHADPRSSHASSRNRAPSKVQQSPQTHADRVAALQEARRCGSFAVLLRERGDPAMRCRAAERTSGRSLAGLDSVMCQSCPASDFADQPRLRPPQPPTRFMQLVDVVRVCDQNHLAVITLSADRSRRGCASCGSNGTKPLSR